MNKKNFFIISIISIFFLLIIGITKYVSKEKQGTTQELVSQPVNSADYTAYYKFNNKTKTWTKLKNNDNSEFTIFADVPTGSNAYISYWLVNSENNGDFCELEFDYNHLICTDNLQYKLVEIKNKKLIKRPFTNNDYKKIFDNPKIINISQTNKIQNFLVKINQNIIFINDTKEVCRSPLYIDNDNNRENYHYKAKGIYEIDLRCDKFKEIKIEVK